MTRTRQPGNACRRWRKTSGAAQQLRSSRGQVSFFCVIALYIFCYFVLFMSLSLQLYQPPTTEGSRTNNWSFHVPRKPLKHCFLPFHPADNCHMVWKLSHNWSKCCITIIHARGMPLVLAIILSFWPNRSGNMPICLPALLKWLSLPEKYVLTSLMLIKIAINVFTPIGIYLIFT